MELITRFVGDEKRLQHEIVSWLDDNDIDEFLIAASNYPQCQRISSRKFKGLSKSKPTMIKKLVEQFGLDVEIFAPKFCLSVKSKDLKYWIKNLNGGNILLENWRDLILRKVKDSIPLQTLLIEELVRSKVEGEANYFVKALDLDLNDFGLSVATAIVNERIETKSTKKSCQTENYVKLPPDFSFSMVDNCEKFKVMCESLKNEYLWGIDCEFNSDVMRTKVSLMQIANKSQGFLIDLTSLASTLDESLWKIFVEILSGHSSVNQFLAFDPREDFRNLAKTLEAFEKIKDIT